MERTWSLEDVANQAGYLGERVAAYKCVSCGTIFPEEIGSSTIPPRKLEDYPCPPLWGGCGAASTVRLVSDGIIDE